MSDDASRLRSLEVELATLRAAVEGCFDAFYLLRSVRDEAGQIVDFTFDDVNQVGLRALQMEREALIGQRLCELFPVNLRAGFFEQYRRVAETGEPLEQEFQLFERLVGWFQHRVVPAGDGVAIVMRRISERREQREREAQREELLQTQKMDALGRLAGGIAHDFNNLLTPILAYANLGLVQLQPGDPLYEELDEIRQAADRATGLIRQVLTFSRKEPMQVVPVAPNRVIEGLARMLRRLVGDGVDVELQLDSELGNVLADPSRIEQILINLVINARDAIPGEGRVTIATRNVELGPDCAGLLAGAHVLIEVRDTGTGMSPEVQRRVFEPFYTTKEQVKGTGLGLAIVYGLVKQHGGDIRCDSEPGRGTVFRVLLPRTDEPLYDDDSGALATSTRPVDRATETVLLVEDDEAVRKLTRHLLVARGYTVLEADNGMSALRVADGHPGVIDLLLTDVIMPRLGGPQLFARLVAQRPGLKVVYMSGFADVETGGAHFLAKPFAGSRLLRTIREALARTSASEA
jgi:signal transduction histidine kinase